MLRGIPKCWWLTTVIEVGVDVRNASCIIIEGAESFGLAALHQLRGGWGERPRILTATLFRQREKQVPCRESRP